MSFIKDLGSGPERKRRVRQRGEFGSGNYFFRPKLNPMTYT